MAGKATYPHEVRGAYSGRQVLDAVHGFDPDVLVLDIAMPDLSAVIALLEPVRQHV